MIFMNIAKWCSPNGVPRKKLSAVVDYSHSFILQINTLQRLPEALMVIQMIVSTNKVNWKRDLTNWLNLSSS